MAIDRVPEAVLSRIWNEGWHSRELRTSDGRRVGVVYRGVWTHSNGPDFRDAMLEIDGRLVHGSVELHVRSSDWDKHGHQFDPAYDSVVLHVVLENDSPALRSGPSGLGIPTVGIAPYLHGNVDDFMFSSVPIVLGDIGSRACLPTLAGDRPGEIHATLRREGWKRLHEKQLRLQQELALRPPGEVLYRALLDSLGLSANRPGMEAVADALPLALAERIAEQYGVGGILSALVGVAGFVPLSPPHLSLISGENAALPVIDQAWEEIAARFGLRPERLISWNLNRVRPLNHPVRRLASLASLLATSRDAGLLSTVLELPLDDGTSWEEWLATARPGIGESRRKQMIVNALAPFVAAYAESIGDDDMLELAGDTWELLAGKVDDDVARKTLRQITGGRRFPVRSALEVQGLHQIGRHGCAHMRCFECPIAMLAVRFEETQISG